MKTVVLISADTEWRVLRERFPEVRPGSSPFGEYLDVTLRGHAVRLFQGGWGKISAAASAHKRLWWPRPTSAAPWKIRY